MKRTNISEVTGKQLSGVSGELFKRMDGDNPTISMEGLKKFVYMSKEQQLRFEQGLNPFDESLVVDQKFGPASVEFELVVPKDYDHDTQVDTFAKKTKGRKDTYYFNENLTSKNFADASNKLVPGKKYKVSIYPILKTATSEECIAFLKKQDAVLVGAQGILLAQDLHKDKFPVSRWTVSFDEKESLWKDAGGRHRVPRVGPYSDGDWNFYLGYFEGDWGDDRSLLCFRNLD